MPPIMPPQDGFLFLDKAKFAESFAADVAPDAQGPLVLGPVFLNFLDLCRPAHLDRPFERGGGRALLLVLGKRAVHTPRTR